MRIHLAYSLALFNMSSQRAARVLVALQALALGAEPATVGLLGATFALVPALLSWHAGRIIDRLGARRPLTLGAALGSLGLLLPYFFPTLPVLFVAGLLCGLGATFYNLSLQNLVGVMSTPADRARNYSNYTMVISVATAVGPVLAGIAIDRAGYTATFLMVAATLSIPVLLLAIWGRLVPAGGGKAAPSQGLRATLTNPRYLPVLLGSFIAQSGLELFHVFLPVYAHERGLSASATGLIVAMAAVGGFAGRFLLTRLTARWNEGTVLAGALFLGAVSFAAVPLSGNVVVLSLIALAFGAGLNCSQPLTLIQIFGRAQQGRTGEVLGVRFAMDNVARLASPIALGAAAAALGTPAVFWLTAVLLGAGGAMARADAKRGRANAQNGGA